MKNEERATVNVIKKAFADSVQEEPLVESKKSLWKKSVINFYSDIKSDTGAHNVSSGIITDFFNLSLSAEKSGK